MMISSGKFKVLENNNKTAIFFGDIKTGDIIEVVVNLKTKVSYSGVSDGLITVVNHTQSTNRKTSPINISKGLSKLNLEPVSDNELEYQRGYSDAYSELQSAYMGNYIEEMFEDEDEE